MRKEKLKSQKAAISIFVVVAMLFFLVTIMGLFMITSKRAQTQTESFGMIQDQYYEEGEETEKYFSKIATSSEIIPIYSKEQFWSIGTGTKVEIEGKIYTFSDTAQYQLQNDIIINIKTDLARVEFKEPAINKNNHKILYYYEDNYYTLLNYSGTKIAEGNAVLCASGENFSTITKGVSVVGSGEKYYLFATTKPPVYGTAIASNYEKLYSSFDSKNPIKRKTGSLYHDTFYTGNYECAWTFFQTHVNSTHKAITSNTANDYLAPVTTGNNTNIFTQTVKDNWIGIFFRACGATTGVYFSQFKLNFLDNSSLTINEAVNLGYIEPLVVYSSGTSENSLYNWQNIGNILNGGQTDTKNYPQAIIMLKVKEKSPLRGVSFYTNKAWTVPNDGFVVRVLSDIELSTEPFQL